MGGLIALCAFDSPMLGGGLARLQPLFRREPGGRCPRFRVLEMRSWALVCAGVWRRAPCLPAALPGNVEGWIHGGGWVRRHVRCYGGGGWRRGGELEKELVGARVELAAAHSTPGSRAAARSEAAQGGARALEPVGARIKSAQDRLDGLRGRAVRMVRLASPM